MKTIKYSRQREAILKFLHARTDHPTAETVYFHVKELYPNISRGTVYRNLNFLAEQGAILKLSVDDESAHFDANTYPHCHFFCKKCSMVYDVELNNSKEDQYNNFINSLTKHSAHRITGCNTIFYGICNTCLNSENK